MNSIYHRFIINTQTEPCPIVAHIIVIQPCRGGYAEMKPIRCIRVLSDLRSPSGTPHVQTIVVACVFFGAFRDDIHPMDPETEFFRHDILLEKTCPSKVIWIIKRRRLLQFLSKLIRFDAFYCFCFWLLIPQEEKGHHYLTAPSSICPMLLLLPGTEHPLPGHSSFPQS